jgi:hypothetical protein
MNQLNKIFAVLARDCNFWLPDYSQNLKPFDKENKYITDTEAGFKYYCEWLTDYLTQNVIPVTDYQWPIISRLKKRKEISNVYILANVGISSHAFCDGDLKKYPSDFLSDPNPNRMNTDDLINFKEYFDVPKFRGLNSDENLQASLVFEYIAIKQNELYEKIEGPRWLDIGWRPILKEGLATVKNLKSKREFTKKFINEIAYLLSK